MRKKVVRTIFILFGLLSLLLGIIGAFLPILPTVPFLLLAAFCFSKGFDGKVRYSRPLRLKLINDVKELLLKKGAREEQMYFCME